VHRFHSWPETAVEMRSPIPKAAFYSMEISRTREIRDLSSARRGH
jgi:hypothetical protein